MTQSVEQLKQEISEQYIKDLKKELWRMKSLVLFPIENKVKKILTWEIDLPSKFDEVEEFGWRKNIINFVTPDTALKIFNFMKEKRLEIEQRKTEQELQDLKNEKMWLPIQSNQDQSSQETEGQQSSQETEEQQTSQETEEQQSSQETEEQQSSQETEEQQTSQETEEQQTSQETEEQQSSEETEEQQSENQNQKSQEQTDNNGNPAVAWAVTSWVWIWATRAIWKFSESANYKKLAEWIDAEKIKWTISAWIEALKKQKSLEGRLSSHQEKTIDKHIKKLEKWLEEVWKDDAALLKLWWELDNKLPKELLNWAWISQKQMLALEKIADKLAECKNLDEMKALLRENNITWISDEVLSALKNAKDAAELKKMTKILRNGSRINRFIQTLAWAMLIDVACLWLDVWVYLETKKEAELIAKVNEVRANNKNKQANWQLWIWIWSVLVEGWIITACVLAWTSTWGPAGMLIWLAVWAVATAASLGVDSLYFDVQDFYLQNKEDFIREKKSKINQAILQWLYNKKNWNVSLNEKIWAPDSNQKEQSLYDACRSMIFLDEIQDGKFSDYTPFLEYLQSWKSKEDFVKELNEEQKTQFEEKWNWLEEQIKLRMEYIDKIFKWDEIINWLKEWRWMDLLNKLFTESRVYWEMKSEGKRDETATFDTNLTKYKSEYFSEFSKEKLEKIEKLKQDSPLLFQEIIVTSALSSLLWEDEEDQNYTENVKLIKKYQDWLKLTQTDKEKIAMEIQDSHKNVNFIERLLRADFDITKVEFKGIEESDLKDIIWLNEERNWDVEISDNPFQNTLYRLAKELFGYKGKNTKQGVMEFYSESDWNAHGFYYKDAWIINNDWAIDSWVKWVSKRWEVFSSDEEVKKYVNNFMKTNFERECHDKDWWAHTTHVDSIDTPTETVDNNLIKEFETAFEKILTEELMQRTVENQEKIKNEIIDFVKNQSKDWEYIELPYYLIIKAKKAWFWDLQRQFFKRKDWKLEVCLLSSELTTNTLDAKITYLTAAREEFTDEEKIYIDRVERAHDDVENLRELWWTGILTDTFTDELDLPKEVEILISDKYKEREKFKTDVKMYSSDTVIRIWIYEKYKEFAEYFENLYRWILLALTTYSVSNDVDTYSIFSQAVSLWNWNYFDEKWALVKDAHNEFLKNPKLETFYNEQITKQTVEWKTVQELWNSEKSEEKELAQLASKEILTAILEQSMLTKDDKWKITQIHIWGHRFDSDNNDWFEDQKSETEKKIKERLSKLKVLPIFDKSKIDELMKPQEITTLKEHKEQVVKELPDLQKKIEETRDDVVWQWKRWDIVYDPEEWTLKSWWKKIKIEEKDWKYYLENLDTSFSNLKEILRIANFRNRALAKFSGKEIEYDRDLFNSSMSFRGTLVAKESRPKSDTMLIARWDLENYCPSCKSDDLVKNLAKRLNSQLN